MKRLNLILLLVLVVPIILFAQINWTEHNIANDFFYVYGLFAIDLDSDGDVDVLGTSNGGTGGDCISWWENDGNSPPTFDEHIIDPLFEGARSVFAIDINGDSAVDVLGAADRADDIIWWENDGNENFTKHTIDSFFDGASSVYAIDINGDSAVDVLGAASAADDITWWENDGNENFTKHTIKGNFDGANCVYAIDIEPDGDMDILGTAGGADDITWWENDGNESFTEHTIKGNFDGANCVYAIDIEPDGDVDVLGTALVADDITWWENDGNEGFTEHTIKGNFNGAERVYAIDMDGDTDVDVLGTAFVADDITWWENDGSEAFTEHTIEGDFNTATCVYAIDIEPDGDVDVLGASQFKVTWWESDFTDLYDVGTISIDIPSTLPEDTTLKPKITVKNFGTLNETFHVICTIDPGGYISMRQANNLAPGDSIQITNFPPFCFESGTYIVTGYTLLGDDENPVNDTLVKEINAVGVVEGGSVTPAFFSFGLKSNPAKGKAMFNLALPEAATVTLRIYDVTGRMVHELKTSKSAGYYEIPWTSKATAGVYFYKFESPWKTEVGKLVIIQ